MKRAALICIQIIEREFQLSAGGARAGGAGANGRPAAATASMAAPMA
jgi:hypothetical protein